MRKTTQQGILVRDPLIALFFFEYTCKYCAYVYSRVLKQLENELVIRVLQFEINADRTTEEVKWFRWYSSLSADMRTPTIYLVDRYQYDIYRKQNPVKILHIWKQSEKEEFMREDDKAKAEMLRDHIIEAVDEYRRKILQPTHNMYRVFHMSMPVAKVEPCSLAEIWQNMKKSRDFFDEVKKEGDRTECIHDENMKMFKCQMQRHIDEGLMVQKNGC